MVAVFLLSWTLSSTGDRVFLNNRGIVMGERAFHLGRLKYVIILLLLVLWPLAAQAQDVKGKVLSLSQSAMEDYDFFELESADDKLMQATQLIESSGTRDPSFANVYVAQAVVSYGRFKDAAPAIADERAYSALLKALAYNPDVDIPPDYRSGELESILRKARNAISSGATPMTTARATMQHTPIYEAQRCESAEIYATVPAHPDIYRVVMHYSTGSGQYDEIEMRPSAGSADNFFGVVPGLATQGDSFTYYIEATGRSGNVVVADGSAASPHRVDVIGECGGLSDGDLSQKYGDPLFQFTVGIGTGLTFLRDSKDTMCTSTGCPALPRGISSVSGAGILPFHMKISAMFNLPAHIQLGVQLRGQLVNTQNTGQMADDFMNAWDSLMLGVELRYFPIFRQPFRFYIGLAAGGGGANATVILSDYDNYKDLYTFGYGYISPELGFLWTFHKYVGLALELALPIHFPEHPNVHFDLSVGPYFQF